MTLKLNSAIFAMLLSMSVLCSACAIFRTQPEERIKGLPPEVAAEIRRRIPNLPGALQFFNNYNRAYLFSAIGYPDAEFRNNEGILYCWSQKRLNRVWDGSNNWCDFRIFTSFDNIIRSATTNDGRSGEFYKYLDKILEFYIQNQNYLFMQGFPPYQEPPVATPPPVAPQYPPASPQYAPQQYAPMTPAGSQSQQYQMPPDQYQPAMPPQYQPAPQYQPVNQ